MLKRINEFSKRILTRIRLRSLLMMLSMVFFIPMIIIMGFLLYNLNQFFLSYGKIVQSITCANNYNITFKEEIDSTVYQMIARSMNKYEVEVNLDMKNPDSLIDEAKATFTALKEAPTTDEALGRLDSISKLLDTLKERVDEIDATVKKTGYYDENMSRLDTDIRIITELIQERITEYIYYESVNMEKVLSKMEERKDLLIRSVFIAALILLVISGFTALTITESITKPINELCDVAGKVGKGDFEVRADNRESNPEIRQLSDSFNSMIEQIGKLVENIKAEQINSRNLELRLLQAQINPHFFYNTLDNIVWLSEDDRKEDVAAIVTALSQFFRTTLSGGRYFIRLEEEIAHIEAYLKIQSFRYRDILSYKIDIAKELKDFEIIKMTLQPLVENALYHGIKYKRGMGLIRIGAMDMGDNLLIFVEDDGIGIRKEELLELHRIIKGDEKPSQDNKGFGMSNVAERLRLNYGRNYGIKIESTYGKGTKVEVLIPKIIYKDENNEQN
ncbi:MAG: sensor histidine kinase [Lachnospiraceae bacterium]|nr:sensor histidine kinase [Lachnospiraceae bacterium]